MNPSKTDSARYLAEFHFGFDSDITQIIRLVAPNEDSESEPIKLLEINPEGVPCGVLPISFGAWEKIPYPSIIVEVTPAEFQQIQSHALDLPDNWQLGDVLFARDNVEQHS